MIKLLEAHELGVVYDIVSNDTIKYNLCANPTLVTENNIASYLLETEPNTDSVAYCIYSSGEIVGVITLNNINYLKRSAYIGMIAVRSGAKPLTGIKAARWLVNHCFNTLNLNRVYSHTWSDNEGMDAFYKLLGATHEGTEREHMYKQGKYVDMKIWSILKREWSYGIRN